MGIILKTLAVLVVLAALGLVGFGYLGDLSPVTEPVRQPVDLDAG